MKRLLQTFSFSAFLVLLSGCQGGSTEREAKTYPVTGKVVAVDSGKGTVTLDHEDIPGLMQAMEMEFRAASPEVIRSLAPGDTVEGKLEVRSGETVVSELKKR